MFKCKVAVVRSDGTWTGRTVKIPYNRNLERTARDAGLKVEMDLGMHRGGLPDGVLFVRAYEMTTCAATT